MKVLILTEGGKDKGLGHIIRCKALGIGLRRYMSRMKESRVGGDEIKFVINGEDAVREVLEEKMFKVEINDWVKNYRRLGSKISEKDLVIIDSYKAGTKVYDFVYDCLKRRRDGRAQYRLLCIDDYNRISYPPCVLVNPSIYGEELRYRKGPVYLLGKDYIILHDLFRKIPKRPVRKDVKYVLLTFGGAERKKFMKKMLAFLLRKYPHLKYHIVTSLFNAGFESKMHSSSLNRNVNIYYNLSQEKMIALMLKCDLCISGGGQTLYELMRCRIPTIGICLADNQKLNLESLKKRALIEYIGWYDDDQLFNRLVKAINGSMPYKTRLSYSKMVDNYIDGNGVERIIHEIFENFHR